MVVKIGSSFPSTLQAALLSQSMVLLSDECDNDFPIPILMILMCYCFLDYLSWIIFSLFQP